MSLYIRFIFQIVVSAKSIFELSQLDANDTVKKVIQPKVDERKLAKVLLANGYKVSLPLYI